MSAWANSFGAQLARLREVWLSRQPRERRFLAVLAAVVACAVLAQSLWTAHVARARLHRQLPQLKQQAEVMLRQAGEVRQLLGQPAGPAPQDGPALLAAATLAARNSGLILAPAQLLLEGPRQVRLRASVPFDRWLEWSAALQRDVRLRLINCRVDGGDVASSASGMVRVDALFALPEPS